MSSLLSESQTQSLLWVPPLPNVAAAVSEMIELSNFPVSPISMLIVEAFIDVTVKYFTILFNDP